MTDTVVDTLFITSLRAAMQRRPQMQLMQLLKIASGDTSLACIPNLMLGTSLADMSNHPVGRDRLDRRKLRSIQTTTYMLGFIAQLWERSGEESFGVMLEDFLAKQATVTEWLQREGANWIVEDDALIAWIEMELGPIVDQDFIGRELIPA